ncbi:hypothetical protein GFL49_16940 [Rhizobium leguminosarum bv. viciae]|nr:hypothetical protein [Rhizobium leguminosarum bv. viciae]
MNGVPCGPLIRPFGPPSPRWGEGNMPQRLDALFSPRGEGARRADEGAARHTARVITQASAISGAKDSLTPSPEWPFLREKHSKE